MVKYTLNFFDAVGRGGETIRLMFHASEVEFNDNRMSRMEWMEVKHDCELLKCFSLKEFYNSHHIKHTTLF